MLYRIAIIAILVYISVFLAASLLFMTAFFTLTVASAALPTGKAWAGTISKSSRHARPSKKVFAAESPSPPRPKRRVIRVASASTKASRQSRVTRVGWDRNLNAHPARGLYKRSFRVTATAYTPINTRMEGGRYTFTERDGRAVHGIAVDPDIIPIGSQLWIPGYGHAVADDTGGRIRGHHVDVRIQDYDRMLEWGCRKVRIYVISDGSSRAAKKAASRHIRRA